MNQDIVVLSEIRFKVIYLILMGVDKMFDEVGYSMENMFNSLIAELPNVIKALLLLLLAWVIATIAKNIFQKLLVKVGAARGLSRTPVAKTEEDGETILENIGKLLYFLVFVLFLPSVFGALNMTEVSTPISNMMSQLLNFIPSIIAAAIVIVLGVFVAKLVKDLCRQFFQTIQMDRWLAKVVPEKDATTQAKLSGILANIVYVIVLIPFITIGVEALKIETISRPIQSVLNNILLMIPNIFIAIVLIVAGYYLGRLVGNLLTNLLQGTGINRIYDALGFNKGVEKTSFDLAKFIGTVVQVVVVLFFTVEALHIINLKILNMIGFAVIEYLPFLLSAVLILGVGLVLANLLGNWIKKNTNSGVSAVLIKAVIITFAVFMTLDQLQFATSIVNIAFLLILGGLMVAFAISFGIGGREFAKGRLAKLEEKMDKKDLN